MDVLWIILLALGVIVSNLMVLRYSAKFKFPTQNKQDEKTSKSHDEPTSTNQGNQTKDTSDHQP